MSSWKLRLLGLALVVAGFAPFVTARAADGTEASTLFAEAERAFAAQDYRVALRLFSAARDAGSMGAGTYYNIGVCHYLLRDYDAAEQSFAELAREFPAMRELAEYNRGLALRASGETAAARAAFRRARVSSDDKIAALADAQLVELGGASAAAAPRWRGYFSGGLGYDDNVALIDELLLPSRTASSPLVEGIGVLSRDFASLLRFDASGYWVRYSDTDEFDQSALRLALLASPRLGQWTLTAGPTLGRSAFDGDEFERLVGADLRLRRSIGSRLSFESRIVYDDVDSGSRFSYIEGTRSQLRLMLQHTAVGRLRIGFDVERNDRDDPGVSPSRERWSVAYQWRLNEDWTADTWLMHRESRYSDVSVPRDETLLSLSFAARRALSVGWALNAEYRWTDNDSTVAAYSYDSQRVVLALSRGF